MRATIWESARFLREEESQRKVSPVPLQKPLEKERFPADAIRFASGFLPEIRTDAK